jgi:E3 Ubiquitin ligase
MPGNQIKFWILLAALAVAAAYSFRYAFKAWYRNRIIEDTPTSRVRSAAQGYVELSGRSMPTANSNNKGPLTGLPCAWWRYKIQQRGSGRSRSWTTVDSGTSTELFVLDDDTGQCLVDPSGAEVYPGAATVWYGPEAWPQGRIPNGNGVLGWLVDHLFTGRYRYTEYRLQCRDPIYAIGAFRSLGGPSVQSPSDAATLVLHDWKADQAKLLARFDLNHDGTLSAEEWDRARNAARKQVIDNRFAQTPAPSLPVMGNPADGRAFLLAASDGETLAKQLRRRALLGIGGFLGSSAALTWMLTHV